MKSQHPLRLSTWKTIQEKMLYIWRKSYLIISNSEWGKTKKEHLNVPLFWKHCSRSRYLLSYWVSSSRPRRDESSTLYKYSQFLVVIFVCFLGEFLIYEVSNLTTQTRRIIRFALPAPDREFKLSGWQIAWYLQQII